jgi:hypothetical protein
MGRFLHFGAGPNQLPAPWENLNAEHDIRKRLKFQDGCASRIHAEHVIEHVGLVHALGFMREALRVLEPGGTLRLVFPDVTRFVQWASPSLQLLAADGLREEAERYAAWLTKRHPHVDGKPRAALEMLLTGWGHQVPWTVPSAIACLLTAGFSVAVASDYGAAEDGHHKDVGIEWASMESSAVEAIK